MAVRLPSSRMSSLLRRCSLPGLRMVLLMKLPFRRVPFRLPTSRTCHTRPRESQCSDACRPETSLSSIASKLSA